MSDPNRDIFVSCQSGCRSLIMIMSEGLLVHAARRCFDGRAE
jgi:hypothetical protein